MTISKATDSLGGHVYMAAWDDLFTDLELVPARPDGRPSYLPAGATFIAGAYLPRDDGRGRVWVTAWGHLTPTAVAIFEDRMCEGQIGDAMLRTTRPTPGHPARYRVVVRDRLQIASLLVDLTTAPPAELQRMVPLPDSE